MMSNLMNNPGDEVSNEAERQWWCIEFEFSAREPGKTVWLMPDHTACNCPDCQRIVRPRRSTQPEQKPTPNNQPKDAADENV